MKTQIAWNGVDGYEITNKSIWTAKEEFKPFEVVEISEDDLEFDEDGICYNGIFLVVGGKGYQFFAYQKNN